MRLGGQQKERQLLQSPVPSTESQAGPEDGHLRRRRRDADRDLPHAQRRNRSSRPRRPSFRPPLRQAQSEPPSRPTDQARFQGRTSTPRRGGVNMSATP